MGVNFTGLYRIHLKGEPGDTITFRFGERIYENGQLNPMTAVAGQIKKAGVGGPGAPDTAWQADTYVFSDNPDSWYSPEFTFHTYRYMEIAGLKQPPRLSDIKGIAFHGFPRKTHGMESDLWKEVYKQQLNLWIRQGLYAPVLWPYSSFFSIL